MTLRHTIKLADPGVSPADEHAALRALRSGQLVSGREVQKFEGQLAALVERRHAIATSSGTTALFAAMLAHGVEPGSTVIVPALTFPAPATVAGFLGATVRACDVDPGTLNISAQTLAPLLDDQVSLVIAIDQFGMPAPATELEATLEPYNVPLLVDAACSMGSTYGGKHCGSMGASATFSFHPRKVITTGEGGAVLTDDDQFAETVRSIVNHGKKGDDFSTLGLNLRLGEVGAALGGEQLHRLDAIVERRRHLAKRYREALPLRFQSAPKHGLSNHQSMVAILPENLGEPDRAELIAYLGERGVQSTIASYCLGAIPALQEELSLGAGDTPVALDVHRRGIALPLHAFLSDDDVEYVIASVLGWLDSRGKR